MNFMTSRGDSTCESSIIKRNKLRSVFLKKDRNELMDYIFNLQTSLAINKEIIQDLCGPNSKGSQGYKNSILKLNNENANLHQKIKEMVKEKNNFHSRILILEQMIEEQKTKEKEQIDELNEKVKELLEQLNLKEYHLQVALNNYRVAENLIMKNLHNIPQGLGLINELSNNSKNNVGITNVVMENEKMKLKVKELNEEIVKLKHEMNNTESKKLVIVLKEKINLLVEENESQHKKLVEQTKMTQEVYDLNQKLSEQLSNLNKQVSVLMHGTKINNIATTRTHRYNKSENGYFRTQNIAEQKYRKSFDNVSSISKSSDPNDINDEYENVSDS